jgi:hypothetical protein
LTIEDNDDSDDLVIIGEKVDNSNKGKKTIEAVNQDVVCIRLRCYLSLLDYYYY